MIRTREDLAWAAGLFEGEGCFTSSVSHKGCRWFRATVSMTDADTVARFSTIIGFGHYLPVKSQRKTWKPMFRWYSTTFEQFQAAIALMWPWLGERRKARAKQLLLLARDYFQTGRIR